MLSIGLAFQESITQVNSDNNHDIVECSPIIKCVEGVRNTSITPVSIRDTPIVVMDGITKYLTILDIRNFNDSDVYQEKKLYHNLLKKIIKWRDTPCASAEENKKLAVDRIMGCIREKSSTLNLQFLNLKSIPNINSLSFLKEILYEGNDPEAIYGCFSKEYTNHYRLNKPSILPDGLESISLSTVDSRRLHYKYYHVTYLEKINELYMKVTIGHSYSDDYERDFMAFFRL